MDLSCENSLRNPIFRCPLQDVPMRSPREPPWAFWAAGSKKVSKRVLKLSLDVCVCVCVFFPFPARNGCGFFAYSWKLPSYSGAFYLQLTILASLTYSWSFFAYSFSFFAYSWSFFAYSGKLRLIRTLKDCKQRSLTVSKKTPTVSKKASPARNGLNKNKKQFF